VPLMFCFSLSAQITKEEADSIVIERMYAETKPCTIYAKEEVQTGFEITTATSEVLELDYSCWVYYVNFTEIHNSKYLIVRTSNGNLLEVNAKNDDVPDLEEWRILERPEAPCYCIMDTLKGEWSWIKKHGGYWGQTVDSEFKSIIKILSQNEDTSINYEVFVEDTLYYSGNFQIMPYGQLAQTVNIKLPHRLPPSQDIWMFNFRDLEWQWNENMLSFWDICIDGYWYYYQKIR